MPSTTSQAASATLPTANGENPKQKKNKNKKQLILNAFVSNSPGHLAPGLWKHPRNRSTEYNDIKFWQELAQTLEKENFHSLFIADILGAYDSYKGPGNHGPAVEAAVVFPVSDPMYIVPAMAAVTKNLTFGVTASTTYDKPYALARKFSTLDHLTKGRIAWNIVTSYLESAAQNFGLDSQVSTLFMNIIYKLSSMI
jgi:alkanesulfonate monooxygenase SsuD/methylene tetrahydromethanopterin reductase-like flavin-dependent oxidoreductase (luciferase family)